MPGGLLKEPLTLFTGSRAVFISRPILLDKIDVLLEIFTSFSLEQSLKHAVVQHAFATICPYQRQRSIDKSA